MTINRRNIIRLGWFGSAAISGVASILAAPAAQAQAFVSNVDVCTGLSIDASDITTIVGEINEPIVTPIQSTINGLLNIADPLNILPDLSIDLAAILDAASMGAPISVQVFDTDGNIVSTSDACNVTADGYTLNTEGGISIGGNQITGLGANGQAATADDIDAIAFGNNAQALAGATASIAIGSNSSVSVANSVALGADSIADRLALTGYSAPGLSGTYDSVGSVSIGSVGAERQITNVAPGTAATDAATVGQVQGALDAVAALDALAVQYDDGTQATITLGGAGGTTISNVAAGALSVSSTEAVNGAQLFATNQAVAANTTAITQNTANIATNTTNIATNSTNITANTNAITVLQGDVATNTTNITNNTNAIASLSMNAVQYSDASQTEVVLGGAGGTTISNVADATLAANSDEAVNGSQLYATNQNVSANTTEINNLDARITVNEGDISILQAQIANVPIGYVSDSNPNMPSATPTNTAAFIGATAAPVQVTNVAEGTLAANSTDAVNGGQLYATNQAVAANTTEISNIYNNLSGSTVAAVQYSNPDTPTSSNGGTVTNDVTLVGANSSAPVALHNVANGVLANDAANVGQLQSVLADANRYTDLRFAEVNFDLRDLRRASFAGTAGALAIAGLPQVVESNGNLVAGAIGHYRGETAFAIGISSAFNDGRTVVKFNGSVDTHGYAGVSSGVGFSF